MDYDVDYYCCILVNLYFTFIFHVCYFIVRIKNYFTLQTPQEEFDNTNKYSSLNSVPIYEEKTEDAPNEKIIKRT